jgi:hypothetical protein
MEDTDASQRITMASMADSQTHGDLAGGSIQRRPTLSSDQTAEQTVVRGR